MRCSRPLQLILPIVLLSTLLSAHSTAQSGAAYQSNPVAASVFDTRNVPSQIDESFVFQPLRPENPLAPPKAGPANNLRAGQMNPAIHRGNTTALWPAIGATGWVPPDPTLAVGPNHVIASVNASIAFFDKTGAKQFQQTSTTFFNGLGAGTFQFDPRVLYDRIHQRFIIIYDEEDDATKTSKILFAISDDADPNGTWYRYRFEAKVTIGASSYWLDYPGLGYNKDAYVVSGNMFGFTSGFAGAQFIVIPSAAALTGGPVTPSHMVDSTSGSVQLCEMIDPNTSIIYGVTDWTTTSVRVYALQNLTGSPTFTGANVTVPAFATPTRDAKSTSSTTLDALDGRMFSAHWRNGQLVTAHCIINTNLRARWYQIATGSWPASGAPSLTQSGEISGGSVDYHMPSINQNSLGDISMIFSRSWSTITADIMYAGRKSTDPAGVMGAPQMLETSLGTNYTSGRWGDYLKVDVDPVDDTTFWGIGMDVDAANHWKTSIFSWTVSSSSGGPPPAPTGLTATAGNAQVSLSWNASVGATSYNVKRSTTSGGPYSTVASPAGTSVVDSGLTNGTTYYYVVTAVNASGESGNSNEASATPQQSQSQAIDVIPTAITPINGSLVGAVTTIQTSDNVYLTANPDSTQARFIATGKSTLLQATKIDVTVEAKVDRGGIDQIIELLVPTTGAYVQIDRRAATNNADGTVTISVVTNPSQFIAASTGQIKARISYVKVNGTLKFVARVDYVHWKVYP